MALQVTHDGNTLVFRPGKSELLSEDAISQALSALHGLGEVFALDTVGWMTEYRLFLRFGASASATGPRLEQVFGAMQKDDFDYSGWLHLKQGECGVVQPVDLSDHAVLPIAHYAPEDARERWQAVLRALASYRGDMFPGRLGVRVALRPAGQDWRERFIKSAPGDDGARGTNNHRDRWDAKASGPAFHAQIQLLAICQDDPQTVDVARADLARLAALVTELTGQPQAWTLDRPIERSLTREAVRALIERTGRSTEAWPELRFLADEGAAPYALSAEEAAALWPAWMPLVRLRYRTPQDPTTTGVEPPAAPEHEGAATPPRSDGHEITHRPLDEPPATGSDPVQEGGNTRVQALVHSSRPQELPVRSTPDPKELRRGRRRRRTGSSERVEGALAQVRPSVMRQMGLSDVDIAVFDCLGDSPLASHEELAYSWGLAVTAVDRSIGKLKDLELVESVSVYIGGERRERSWIPEDCWARVFDDRPLPHIDHMVRRLWNNPEMVSAVYRLVGILTQENDERELLIVRWLWKRPFDAVVQCNDGWAAFLWTGLWKGREKLDLQLQECMHELRRWNQWGEPAWPGRILFVVPDAWVEEQVWRAVCRRGWEEYCAILNLRDDELVGELGLGGARRWIPPFIREEPPPLKANVERWVELLKNDPASRMSRLLQVIELYPGISASHLGRLTRINGTNVAEGLACLRSRNLIHQPHCDGYSLEDLALAKSARRDGVWSGLPGRRQGKKRTAEYPDLRWRRLRHIQNILVQFHAAGCRVAPGWLAQDASFRPDGVVWLDGGPYGAGWHYLVDARHVHKTTRMRGVLNRALSDERRDGFPILVICREGMEEIVWELGAERPMLTSTPNRIRGRSIVGATDCAWLRYGDETHLMGGRRRNARRKDTDGTNDEREA